MTDIKRILTANRGEIACRIARTVKAMGLESVAVFSDADAGAMHVTTADHSVRIGPGPAVESYLKVDNILAAARETGADAIHPGYGFLSENADFAEACAAEGIVFIGPSPTAIRVMGSKSAAKARMDEASVPLVPGYHGDEQSDAALERAALDVGFPLLVKASAGGGGRGMRLVHDPADLADALASARREAMAAFDDDRLLLERYLDHARHVEVQVFGDHHGNLVHMFERDCSVQRRYQKVIEEAPASGLDGALREQLHAAALKAARAVGYTNAGTVEFIVSGDSFCFMEMNTRLQVEHLVTEAITGLDLVEWQIRIARGEPLPLEQDAITCSGHAFEARLNAEDPRRGFLPASGRLDRFDLPTPRAGLRIDSGFAEGGTVPPFYDSMLAKLIAHGDTREHALSELASALEAVHVAGLTTNRQMLSVITANAGFQANNHDNGLVASGDVDVPQASPLATATGALATLANGPWGPNRDAPPSPWARACGWRSMLSSAPIGEVTLHDGIAERLVQVEPVSSWADCTDDTAFVGLVRVDDNLLELSLSLSFGNSGFVVDDGRGPTRGTAMAGKRITILTPFEEVVFDVVDPYAPQSSLASGSGHLASPMPGTVVALPLKAGDSVARGVTLVVVEAMKMEHAIVAPHDGTIVALNCAVGDLVAEGAELVVLEAVS